MVVGVLCFVVVLACELDFVLFDFFDPFFLVDDFDEDEAPVVECAVLCDAVLCVVFFGAAFALDASAKTASVVAKMLAAFRIMC